MTYLRSILALGLAPFALSASDAPVEKDQEAQRKTPSAVVEVTAPLPKEGVWTETDPRAAKQPVPAKDGAEALRTVPGFSVARKGGTDGDPILRGMAGSRLGVLLDGEMILGGCGGRMDPPTAYVFPEAYDRIRVLKGPQSVLHGPGTSAGVVLFERDAPSFPAAGGRASGSFTGGAWGRLDGAVEAQGGNRRVYGRLDATRTRSDDYRDGRGNPVHSRYTRWSLNGAAGWTPTEDLRLELSAAQSDGQAAYADRGVDGSKFRRENLGFKAELSRVAPWLEKLELHVFRNYIDHIMDNYSLRPFVPSMMAPEPAAMNPDRDTAGGRLVAHFRFGAAALSAGLDRFENTHTGRMSMMQWSMPEESMPRVKDACFASTGLFGEWSLPVSAALRVVAGLRVDHWRAEDPRASIALGMMSSVPNPTAGQERKENLGSGFLRLEGGGEGGAYHAGLGRSARFPDYWEAIAREAEASVSAFGTRPERTTQLDLGWTRSAGSFRVALSAYAARIDDYILIQWDYRKTGMMGSARSAAVARNVEARTRGGEAGLTWSPDPSWRLEGSLAYAYGENRSEARPLAQMPPLEARAGASYLQPAWNLGLLVRSALRQERVAIGEGSIVGQDLAPTGAFAVLSLHGGFRPHPALDLSAGVDNLFNRFYAEAVNRAGSPVPGYPGPQFRVPEPGRFAWLRLGWRLR